MTTCDVAIIGAGPYGLSIASHLRRAGVDFRILGDPMHTWRAHMPEGMRLKSEGFASSLYDPSSEFTLEAYCREKGIAYATTGLPVPLEVFSAYGLEFQKRYVPELVNQQVQTLERGAQGFTLRLGDGQEFSARRVVMAVGLTHYKYLPERFEGLPENLASHSSNHTNLDHFKGREVAIVGAGASALDLAALLHQVGAQVQVISRKPVIKFHDPPKPGKPSLLSRIQNPITGIGPGWKLFLCTNAPLLFRQMPAQFRLEKVRTVLGPAPCWFTKQEVVGKVTMKLGLDVKGATAQNGKISLQLIDSKGVPVTITADHVIAATGYRVDLRRLKFLSESLLAEIRTLANTPILKSTFESSVTGLYFVGASAANTFGPLLRFAFGAGFTARRISKHLARSAVHIPTPAREHGRVAEQYENEVGVR